MEVHLPYNPNPEPTTVITPSGMNQGQPSEYTNLDSYSVEIIPDDTADDILLN